MTSSVLFTPVGINRMTLKNRIVMPAMASYHAAVNGEATEKLIRYHEERAKGGVGMNIVEATYVARSGNSFDLGLGISDDFMIKGLSKLADACHAYGAKVSIQLQHGGRFGNPPTSGCPRLLVSMIPGLAPPKTPASWTPTTSKAWSRRMYRPPAARWTRISPSSTAIPPWRTYRNGIDFGTNVELCRALTDAGVNAFDITAGMQCCFELMTPPTCMPKA